MEPSKRPAKKGGLQKWEMIKINWKARTASNEPLIRTPVYIPKTHHFLHRISFRTLSRPVWSHKRRKIFLLGRRPPGAGCRSSCQSRATDSLSNPTGRSGCLCLRTSTSGQSLKSPHWLHPADVALGIRLPLRSVDTSTSHHRLL